jgi:F420-non-reducing hydrogenase small subunit
MADKIKIAQYWGAGCGGCDVALLDIDGKIKDIEAMPDKSITVSFYNGAIRNSENEHIAKLLRQKSVIMISFGSCACYGGTPGLANVTNRKEVFETVYKETESTDNPNGVTPQTHLKVKEGELELPEFYDTVKTLDEVVDVDYFMPGCPPTVNLIAMAVDAVAQHVTKGAPLPPKGTFIASDKTLCDECERERVEKDRRIEKIYQAYEITPDPKKCLLDQGIICIGPATRAGCGAMCPTANMPCRGCMGPTKAVMDHGGSMLSAISSLLGMTDSESKLSEEQIMELMMQVKDPLGTFYAFTLPKSALKRVVTERKKRKE